MEAMMCWQIRKADDGDELGVDRGPPFLAYTGIYGRNPVALGRRTLL